MSGNQAFEILSRARMTAGKPSSSSPRILPQSACRNTHRPPRACRDRHAHSTGSHARLPGFFSYSMETVINFPESGAKLKMFSSFCFPNFFIRFRAFEMIAVRVDVVHAQVKPQHE
jgi:hypothetical protein